MYAKVIMGVIGLGLSAVTCALAYDVPPPIASKKVRELFEQILNEGIPAAKRQELIAGNPEVAGELIGALTDELSVGTAEEYRRIPWLWRIAIQTGQRNDLDEIRAVLEEALPQPNQPLHDWRAVVIGGGVINGISQSGSWPLARIHEILKGEGALTIRWEMMLVEAAQLVEDEKIPASTRYDALRIVALDHWDRRQHQLEKYLTSTNPDLQKGAVSGLVDVDQPAATALLIHSAPHLSERCRQLAMAGLLRGETRQKALIEALERGSVNVDWLNSDQRAQLLKVSDADWHARAEKLLK